MGCWRNWQACIKPRKITDRKENLGLFSIQYLVSSHLIESHEVGSPEQDKLSLHLRVLIVILLMYSNSVCM